jgi:hypothetical protein
VRSFSYAENNRLAARVKANRKLTLPGRGGFDSASRDKWLTLLAELPVVFCPVSMPIGDAL